MEAINLPLYQRIARQLKSAIERGELTPGSRLPASRVYAQEQGVSRATIENARESWSPGMARAAWAGGDLCQRAAQPAPAGAGTASATGRADGAAAVSDGAAGAGSLSARAVGAGDGASAADAVAVRSCTRRSRRRSASARAIVDYLRLSRSIDCQPDQVLITGSYAASMNLILRTRRSRDSICGWKIRGIPLSGRSSRLGSWRWMRFPWTTKGWTSAGASVITRRRDLPCSHQPIRVRWGRAVASPTPPAAGVGRGARRVDH